jgi:uncharacterized protein YkwD
MKTLFYCVSLLLFFNFGAQAQIGLSENDFNLKLNYATEENSISRPRVIVENNDSKSNAPAPTVFDLERLAFQLINEKRAEQGLEALEWNEDIARMARLHSNDMAQNKFFSHSGNDGSMVDDRADRSGIKRWRAIGENIAYNRGYKNPCEFAVEKWMLSPSHKKNLLDTRWKESAIGVAVAADGSYYFTQVFLLRN